jgi:hypothetical protein
MRQYEAVIKVMEENGGFATLSYLYEKALKVPGVVWKTKTPFASIRRIVQDDRFFFKIKPGLWALKTYKNKLPTEILSLIEEETEGKFTHSYYQGLIVEIGNIKGFKTYVPPQDKNKKFLSKYLKELTSLDTILEFTYRDIIRRVQSIDVFWFNDRRFPSCVFEIEHSTDFKNALLKFLELQDFNVQMYVVSPKQRQREFSYIINFSSFDPIKERVEFVSYEEVAQWHARVFELKLIESKIA